MQIIYCPINQFTLKHPVYLVDTDSNSETILDEVYDDDIGHIVAAYSKTYNAPTIHLGGAPADYLDRFVDDIYTVNSLMYSNTNPIEIFIIE